MAEEPKEKVVPGGDELFTFAEEAPEPAKKAGDGGVPWKLLIADDEPEVHSLTQMVLGRYTFEGRGVEFLSAYSGEETVRLMEEHPDTALILLDVVMETNHAGLDAARIIRERQQNRLVRIILRTGQPGQAPEQKVITEYDINDYKNKTELTAQKLFVSVTTALRSYRDLKIIEDNRVALNKLALSVAHQIRNRMITIGGFVNLLRRKEGLDPAVKTQVGVILEETARLEHVVAAVSDFASLPSPSTQVTDVGELLRMPMEELEALARERGKAVAWETDIGAVDVCADPGLFRRALREILENALDFAQEDPVRIFVGARREEIGKGSYCRVSVRDWGPGIAPADAPFIFEPFITTKAQGVGMGLCVARRIVDEHHGQLMVDGRRDPGTEVAILLPGDVSACEVSPEEG